MIYYLMGDPTQIGRTDLAEKVFGYTTIQNAKQKYGLDTRAIWELSTPTTQCYNTISRPRENQPCWLCGEAIDIRAKAGSGLNPECEHVLPIAQARLFLDLYASSSVRGTTISSGQMEAFKLEYDWAHSICNQEKSDDSYIIQTGLNYSVNTSGIVNLLKKIYNNGRVGGDTLRNYIQTSGGIEVWRKRRLDAITNRIQSIINFIQRGQNTNLANLVLLCGVVDTILPDNLERQFSQLLKDKAVVQEVEHIRKEFNELEVSGGLLIGYFSSKLFELISPSIRRNKDYFSLLFETSDVSPISILDWSKKYLNKHVPTYKETYNLIFPLNSSIAEPIAVQSLLTYFLYELLLRINEVGYMRERNTKGNIENLISGQETPILQNPNVPDEFKTRFKQYLFFNFSGINKQG